MLLYHMLAILYSSIVYARPYVYSCNAFGEIMSV